MASNDIGGNVLYFQCFAGISGDMHLAALLGLGLPEQHLRTELAKLGIEDEYTLLVTDAEKKGISGLRVDIQLTHDHSDLHAHHHDDAHTHSHARDYKAIKSLIIGSSLEQRVKQRALAIFNEVAIAEAKIHNQAVDDVHFHEVGGTDSIIDIVGAAIGLEYLIEHQEVERIVCSTVELGSGFVSCAHGEYPVPAPATAHILQNVPISSGRVNGEATTPTGAAILKACVDEFTDELQGKFLQTTYGVGHRDSNVPNVLRAQVLDAQVPTNAFSVTAKQSDDFTHAKLEANIDDMSPEAYQPLFDVLFEAGADDVFVQNITMKKSRPAQLLCILCALDESQKIAEVVLNNSTTIGLRILPFRKVTLSRQMIQVPTSLGDISIKLVTQPNGQQRWKSEHDQVAQISSTSGESYLTVKSQLDQEIYQYLSEQGYQVKQGNPFEVVSVYG